MSIDIIRGSSVNVDRVLTLAGWQPTLYANRLSRYALSKLRPSWEQRTFVVRVHRNHSFEHVASIAIPWLAVKNAQVEWRYSDYDDSLSFSFDPEAKVDAEILWIDRDNYKNMMQPDELSAWLLARVSALRALSMAPILVLLLGVAEIEYATLASTLRQVPGVRLGDMEGALLQSGVSIYDERARKFSGTRLSDAANLIIARELAARWLPALIWPRIKAVVVDLDNTLYQGVLGEDGMDVKLTDLHHALQAQLLALQRGGVFLALASRNELGDVEKLFTARSDFPLKWEDFSVKCVSWKSKAESLREIAAALRIGHDAMVFIDDNPGEIASVASELPEVQMIHAGADVEVTRAALSYTPGLWSWGKSAEDSLRIHDLKAVEQRKQLAATCDSKTYLESLGVTVLIAYDERVSLQRVYELSNKTNQFNLSLARLGEAEIAQALTKPDSFVVTIALTDRLSDSGIIGAIVGRVQDACIIVEDLVISCRALGRSLENIMIFSALRPLMKKHHCAAVKFTYCTGPRNQPALKWLSSLTEGPLGEVGCTQVRNPDSRMGADLAVEIKYI